MPLLAFCDMSHWFYRAGDIEAEVFGCLRENCLFNREWHCNCFGTPGSMSRTLLSWGSSCECSQLCWERLGHAHCLCPNPRSPPKVIWIEVFLFLLDLLFCVAPAANTRRKDTFCQELKTTAFKGRWDLTCVCGGGGAGVPLCFHGVMESRRLNLEAMIVEAGFLLTALPGCGGTHL